MFSIEWHGGTICRVGCGTYVADSSSSSAPLRSGLWQATYTSVPLSPSSITWYQQKLGSKQVLRAPAPYSWPCSVSWCLAEGYRKQR